MIVKAWENLEINKDYSSFYSINSLMNFEESLFIQELDKEVSQKIINEIKTFIDSNEMELVQLILRKEKLKKYQSQLEEFIFNNLNLEIKIDESFWNHIENILTQFKEGIANGCGNDCFDAPELIFSEDCKVHDVMYSFVDSKKEKDQADDYFFFNMKKRAKEQYKGLYPIYKTVAKVYYKGVNVFGKGSTNIEFKKIISQEKPLKGLESFYDDFLGNRLIDLKNIQESFKNKNLKEIRKVMHSWKGYSKPYGFQHLAVLSEEIEYHIEKKNYLEIKDLISEVESYLKLKAI